MIFSSNILTLKNYMIFLMVALSSISCNDPYTPLTIGHRGAKGHVAENTLPSVAKAMELGVDGIEIDIFLCKSGELVVFHDKKLDRLTNAQGYIESLEYDSIQKIKVMGEHKIPTLDEVLELIDGKVFLNIELKGGGTAEPTHKILTPLLKQKKWTADQFIISSFDWEELKHFYRLNQEVPIAVLTGADPLDALPIAREVNAQAINPDFKSLNEKNVKKIQQAGYKVFPYTINDPKNIEKMFTLEVDGIITDYPERVKDALPPN